PYYNLLSVWREIGLDGQRDTYDGGLHLNVHGAQKTAIYFGRILQEHGVPDRREEAERVAYWDKEVQRYDAQKHGEG
ncbi:MAG: SGNH/GDSL hydrolase family protein, partial [Clostridia bacterium]|nr:SGNH/GDSL hydrolase family protein [Clostridia bacterium]